MANLTTVSEKRSELLRFYRDARQEAMDRGRSGSIRAFYFSSEPSPNRADELAIRLVTLGIEVDRLLVASALTGARNFWSDGAESVRLPEGSFRVRLDQPNGLLARAILEPHTPLPDSSVSREREHLERQKTTRIYDVTAWSFLLASGVPSWWRTSLDGLNWEQIDHVVKRVGSIRPGAPDYGWLFDGMQDGAVVLASRLVSAGYVVRAGKEDFWMAGKNYQRGSFLLRLEDNPSGLADSLAAWIEISGVEIVPISTARILEGPDLGGDQWPLLTESKIAIAAGPRVSTYSVGAAWHLLDREFEIRASLVDGAQFATLALERYNVIVLPHAYEGSSAYQKVIDDKGRKSLEAWVKDGGTLIAIGGGAEYLADSTIKISKSKLRRQHYMDFPSPQFGLGKDAVQNLERMQAMGLSKQGDATESAGPYNQIDREQVLGIPGVGSPVIGPGLWAMLGAYGNAARRRGAPAKTDQPRDAAMSTKKPDASDDSKKLSKDEKKAAAKKTDDRLRRFLPSGAIVRVDLDPEFWLNYGCGDRVAVMLRRVNTLLARDPVLVAGRFGSPENIHLGGLLWPEAVGRISQTAYVTQEKLGKGQVILFAFDPNFRGYFWGSRRLFLNAVLLGPGLGTDQSVPW